MDSAPFTLFFVVCLFSFKLEDVLGIPAPMLQLPNANIRANIWHTNCSGKNYCQTLVKPQGDPQYPSQQELMELYLNNLDKFTPQPEAEEPPPEGRIGYKNICKDNLIYVGGVRMIKDEQNATRYALYIPNTFNVTISTRTCKVRANTTGLDQKYKDHGIKCVQKTTQFTYPVLTLDMKGIEFVKIKGLNSHCAPEMIG